MFDGVGTNVLERGMRQLVAAVHVGHTLLAARVLRQQRKGVQSEGNELGVRAAFHHSQRPRSRRTRLK